MIKNILKMHSSSVCFDDVVTLEEIDSLEKELQVIDGSAIDEEQFWWMELEGLREKRGNIL